MTTPKLGELISRDCALRISFFLFACSPPATPGYLTLTAIGRSFGSHGCRQISFPFKFAPQKIDADSELISDRKGNSEIIASRMRAPHPGCGPHFRITFKKPIHTFTSSSTVDKYHYVSHNTTCSTHHTSSESFGHRPPVAAWPSAAESNASAVLQGRRIQTSAVLQGRQSSPTQTAIHLPDSLINLCQQLSCSNPPETCRWRNS